MRLICGFVMVGLLTASVGCDAVGDILSPNSVTVELVNNGEYEVQARFYIADDQNVLESILTEFGDEINSSVEAGGTSTFTRSCDDFQAIILDDAELQSPLIQPDTDTDEAYRDGDEFGCGDRIIFTFDHSDLLIDFGVTVRVE
ncbi:MAG: hypothetical protein GY842_11715 [bacterium]|nr:hypothetical protein [bacterium]